ncbi:hypothetical protein TCAL_02859 [Tigriopus californicus]|uniref:J domain-containing protein n=1 Tax=Tigriopus californicus TaxID=6832 RepID=A0A553NXD9_TIGCA|nr:dnaJ homolog subfamily C member 25 homolog [Tigriopus californicus]TRY70077.1 hypothetical protein TCAL_02859 [Tigriopus californicus]|eukprot:TCALIF_02859-PA protein Name:"Similar to CG7872 DnaJ homolog subfamily C member 25 homolog (Drosophila melanogaster)" AED:0.07 eAED:0.07 QI:173/1/1/1/1/1/4/80/331
MGLYWHWGLVLLFSASIQAQDLYCGDQNCYEVLGVTRDSPKSEFGKSYRKLAGKWHPDRFKTPEEKETGEKKFMQIATAYEVLKDDESREEYNYMLEHPEEMWQNYYRYYRRRMSPKVDVRIVIAVTISVISLIQYYSSWTNYEDAMKYLVAMPKYRIKAMEIAKEDGLLKRDKKLDRGKSKEQIKEEDDRVIRQVIEDKMDIQGGYAKPKVTDVLWVQMIFLPWTICSWTHFYGRWFWKYGIKCEDYEDQDKLYVIRKNMGLSQGQFNSMSEEEKNEFLDLELWKKDSFQQWKQVTEDEMRAKLAQSGRYKQYRRYMRNHGPDRMTFDDS